MCQTAAERTVQRLTAKRSIQPNGCWLWTGSINPDGYGRCGFMGRTGYGAHRAFYELFVGPIPDGMHVDHGCHNVDHDCPGGRDCLHRRCVNPAHLVPRPTGDNTLRGRTRAAANAAKTHCAHDHEFNEINTYDRPDGSRGCRPCRREAGRRHDAKRRAA